MMSVVFLIDKINLLDSHEQYLIYDYLHEEIKANESELLPISRNANDPEYIKSLLAKKKETSIDEVNFLIPYVLKSNQNAREMILKILPVFFSYVTLYEMRVWKAMKIIDAIKVHSAFSDCQHIFVQWYTIFERRKISKNRTFSFKDEFFVSNLPQVDEIPGDQFSYVIGYNNVALLRATHRWLRLHRLHKYLFIFSNLTYEQILAISEENIDNIQAFVGLFKMTVGARNKILREIEELRKRKSILMDILKMEFTSLLEIDQMIREIKKILRTPMKITEEENLPHLVVLALNKMRRVVLDFVGTGEGIIPIYGLLISVLKESWNYSIFTQVEKNCFNSWRNELSDKINSNNNNVVNSFVMQAPEIILPLQSCTSYLSSPDQIYGEFSLFS